MKCNIDLGLVRNYLIWGRMCVCVSLCERVFMHIFSFTHTLPTKDRNMNHTMNQWCLFCLSFRILSSVRFQLACVFLLMLLPDVLYFVLAIEKRVYGLNYSDDGSWMKGADSCTQWQDICMRSLLTLVADTLAWGQLLFGTAMATAFTVVAEI